MLNVQGDIERAPNRNNLKVSSNESFKCGNISPSMPITLLKDLRKSRIREKLMLP